MSSLTITFGIICAAVSVVAPVAWTVYRSVRREHRRVGIATSVAFAAVVLLVDVFYAGEKPPVVVVNDIEIKSYRCDHTGAAISWAFGTNITYGVDKFVIQRATRQIPARTGWSQYADYGETMITNWSTSIPQHASDVRFRVIVRKGEE